MITAIIIDDEQHCINSLADLLKTHCRHVINLAGSFQTIEDGLKAIENIRPNLIFLDVEIDSRTGLDLLKLLPVINFEVIFTTAFNKYAVEAFKFSAIDYLLKPIDIDELKEAVEKSSKKISREDTLKKFDILFYNLKTIQNTSKRICIPDINGFHYVQVNDIIRCESSVNYTTFFLKEKQKLTVSKTLKEFEELLVDYNFFRVHHSHLINISYVKSYNKGKGGTVLMTDGSQIEVSTRKKEGFIKRLSQA